MFIPRLWRHHIDSDPQLNDTIDVDNQAVEVLCPLILEKANSTAPETQLLAFREIIDLSTTRGKWERDQLLAFFEEKTVTSWKRDNEQYTGEWLDLFEQTRLCLTRSSIIEDVDQIERYSKLSLRAKATAAINDLLGYCQQDSKSNNAERLVAIRFYVNVVWNTPIDTVEYFANFSNVSQLVLSQVESYITLKEKSRETVDEVNALLFHQFLWVMWTSGPEHVNEIAVWEIAFKLIEICRSDKSRFSNVYFYAGNDWNKLLHDAVAKKVLQTGPLLDILLEGAPRKDDEYDSFVEKKFPFGPDSKVSWPSTTQE
ncbi:hypothetical protein SCHPADRAFT_931042 [Schizopora paradoxa]|uniref:Uncharacterized protein n=1 Tax=Schizopora paradoxa TaxID=27342 RepID=A0A0H2RJJ7_9AGAM|nr:hypothetical protein SCHPADRAFT_931042 [Schizopora paradoxa]